MSVFGSAVSVVSGVGSALSRGFRIGSAVSLLVVPDSGENATPSALPIRKAPPSALPTTAGSPNALPAGSTRTGDPRSVQVDDDGGVVAGGGGALARPALVLDDLGGGDPRRQCR